MSKSVLEILLEELKSIQIVCRIKDCGTILEISMERLGKTHEDGGQIRCPLCSAVFQASHYSALGELAQAVLKLTKRREDIGVRFIIPQPAKAD